jgi:hypothetical protein
MFIIQLVNLGKRYFLLRLLKAKFYQVNQEKLKAAFGQVSVNFSTQKMEGIGTGLSDLL